MKIKRNSNQEVVAKSVGYRPKAEFAAMVEGVR